MGCGDGRSGEREDGLWVGSHEGRDEGLLGTSVGAEEVGRAVGCLDGRREGPTVGKDDGNSVGAVGRSVGSLGAAVGEVGPAVGTELDG